MDVGFHGTCIVNNRLWFSLTRGNGLCTMDLDTREFKYVASIPGENISGVFLYEEIKCYGHKLFLVPRNAKEIAVYDMDADKISKVPIYTDHLKYKGDYDGFGKFYSALIVNEWIYFVPCHFPAIVKMNMKTFEVLYLDEWIKDILPYYRKDRAFFRKDTVRDKKGAIYLTSLYYNMILSVDIKTDKTVIVRKGCVGDGCGCSCIAYQNNTFALFEMNQRRISLFDHYWKLKQQFNCPNVLSEKYRLDYIQSISWKNYIFYIPYGANMMLRLNIDANSIDVVRQWSLDDIPLYIQTLVHQDKLYCFRNCMIDIFNIEGFLKNCVFTKEITAFWNNMLSECFKHETILCESGTIYLTDYIDFLEKGKVRSDISNPFVYGNEIYTNIQLKVPCIMDNRRRHC